MWVRIWPHLALLLAMVFWSTSYVALRIALSALDPFTVMAGRMGVATLLFLPLWGGLLRDLRRKGQWRWLLLMAFAEPCCYFLLETRALCLTTASQAGMIISLLPLITAVVAWRLLGERVSLRGWIGFALAVAGVVWLSLQSAWTRPPRRPCWAISSRGWPWSAPPCIPCWPGVFPPPIRPCRSRPCSPSWA